MNHLNNSNKNARFVLFTFKYYKCTNVDKVRVGINPCSDLAIDVCVSMVFVSNKIFQQFNIGSNISIILLLSI